MGVFNPKNQGNTKYLKLKYFTTSPTLTHYIIYSFEIWTEINYIK